MKVSDVGAMQKWGRCRSGSELRDVGLDQRQRSE